jgi:hypothetical protein
MPVYSSLIKIINKSKQGMFWPIKITLRPFRDSPAFLSGFSNPKAGNVISQTVISPTNIKPTPFI